MWGGAFHGDVRNGENGVHGRFNVGKGGVNGGTQLGGARDGSKRVFAEVEVVGEVLKLVFEGGEGGVDAVAKVADVCMIVGSGKGGEDAVVFLMLGVSDVGGAVEVEPTAFVIELDGDG